MHFVKKMRNDVSLHESAFHRAHTVSQSVLGYGATAPRRRLTLAGNHAWTAALFCDGDEAAFERYQSAYSTEATAGSCPRVEALFA
jgi:hypothetical protein